MLYPLPMLRFPLRSLSVILASLMWVAPLLAHHEILGKFDPAKAVTLNGQVTKVEWVSPHVHVLVNVGSGTRTTNWAIELDSPLDLERSGWNRNTLKPGDAIAVQGIRARDGSLQAAGNAIVLGSTGKSVVDVTRSHRRTKPAPVRNPPARSARARR